jgi:putative ABC transport system permease protein
MMNLLRLVTRSLRHYPASHLATAAGIAISTAVICGALIIGDSLSQSLLRIVDTRLGQTTHTVTAGERIFTRSLVTQLNKSDGISAAPVLKTEAVLTVQGSGDRIGKVQVWGVDTLFHRIAGVESGELSLVPGEALLSQNLAERLGLDTGDYLLMRIRKTGPIPPNTPFVSEGEQTVSRRIRVGGIAGRETVGRFNLQASQVAPLNMFVLLDWLNELMGLRDMANLIVVLEDNEFGESRIMEGVRQSWRPPDGALEMTHQPQKNVWNITSSRVFIDHYLTERITQTFPAAKRTLTYFVNGIAFADRETPYSFVAATDHPELQPGRNEAVISQWLADDLGAGKGDTLRMRYFEVGPLRELEEKEVWLVVAGILPMEITGKYDYLMPDLPGLSDAGSCSEWETGVPIDLDAIRQKDEDYWDTYRGTPKAFISLEQGMELWQNRFGNMTGFMVEGNAGDREAILEKLSGQIDPFRLEFQLNPVRQQGLAAAKGGVDFSQLFAGLGVFIILAGLLLTALFLGFGLKKREGQLKLFASIGFSERLIRRIMLTEAAAITLLGAGLGLVLSIGYSRLVFGGLNQIWQDIVRTDVLILHFNPAVLAAGLTAGIVLGLVIVWLGVKRLVGKSLAGPGEPTDMHPDHRAKTSNWPWFGSRTLALTPAALLMVSISTALFLFLRNESSPPFAWFLAGGTMLVSLLAGAWSFLRSKEVAGAKPISLNRLSWKNIRRNPVRSFTIIALLALGSFVIVLTAANRKDLGADAFSASGGTGGFWFMAETSAPVLRNLNQPDTRLELGIPDETYFVQFHSAYDDDASCLNLNRVENPRILATDPSLLKGRFSFVSAHPMLDPDDPWGTLNAWPEGVVPAIADQSVIQWGLGKKVGDTLVYVNAGGEEVRLLLVGGLSNSVFQGNVIISSSHFLKNFPSRTGTDVFLVGGPSMPEKGNAGLINAGGEMAHIFEELAFIFRDHGWEMIPASEKLAEFNTVENTYLGIFFMMGAFGMLLGTVGLAIILAKSMLERRSETALLKAVGYPLASLVRLFSAEYLVLLSAGLLAGTLPALLATLPTFLEGSQNVPAGFLAAVIGLLIMNGVFWILAISYTGIQRMVLLQSLQNE